MVFVYVKVGNQVEGMTREASQQVARAEDKLSHSRDQQMTSHTKLKQAEQAKEEAISNIETAKDS